MDCKIEEMIGLTFTSIENIDDEELIFKTDQYGFRFYHEYGCCESVEINDIIGDLDDLIGSPILRAEERTSHDEHPENCDVTSLYDDDNSFTWTFYEFATIKGSVTVRWLGQSNGYYSEAVDLEKITYKDGWNERTR